MKLQNENQYQLLSSLYFLPWKIKTLNILTYGHISNVCDTVVKKVAIISTFPNLRAQAKEEIDPKNGKYTSSIDFSKKPKISEKKNLLTFLCFKLSQAINVLNGQKSPFSTSLQKKRYKLPVASLRREVKNLQNTFDPKKAWIGV